MQKFDSFDKLAEFMNKEPKDKITWNKMVETFNIIKKSDDDFQKECKSKGIISKGEYALILNNINPQETNDRPTT